MEKIPSGAQENEYREHSPEETEKEAMVAISKRVEARFRDEPYLRPFI